MGCDHITTAHQLADGLVSIHAPAWGATAYQYVAGYVTKFQSTHPRGVRLLPQIGADAIIRFQSTHPRGVRRRALPCWPASTRFQSTHPRGVRHASLERVPHEALVSIHAPAWGATGAWIKGHARMSCFNPRTRVGCDLLLSVGFGGMEADVSIHAPAWGATNANESPFRLMKCFNSRTRVGCDEPDFDGWLERHGVSIHAPAWGATERKRESFPADEMFQFTHPRGVRRTRL